MALLIAFSIYFCLITNKTKQKHLFPYHITNDKNDKLKEISIINRMCYYFDNIIKIQDFKSR